MALLDPERWRILSPLLDHALDLSEPDRQSWLDEIRTESAELAAELSTLLASDSAAEAQAFLAAHPDVSFRDASRRDSPRGGALLALGDTGAGCTARLAESTPAAPPDSLGKRGSARLLSS